MNRLFCETKVTAVSPFAHLGLDSGAVVRVTCWRVRATVSTTTMSPPSAKTTRRRAVSQVPPAGGASFRSSSERRRGVVVSLEST